MFDLATRVLSQWYCVPVVLYFRAEEGIQPHVYVECGALCPTNNPSYPNSKATTPSLPLAKGGALVRSRQNRQQPAGVGTQGLPNWGHSPDNTHYLECGEATRTTRAQFRS